MMMARPIDLGNSMPTASSSMAPMLPPSLTLDQGCRTEASSFASQYASSSSLLPPAPSAPRFVVLVVDDNAINRKVLSIPLRKQGIEVVEAENGLQAVEAYALIRPSLILMDISMPIMDGFEATRQIRSLEMASALQSDGMNPLQTISRARIVAATTHSSDQDYQDGQDAGMDDWLLKPIRPSVLVKDILEFKNMHQSQYQ